jgi:toxin ParE1/3/4
VAKKNPRQIIVLSPAAEEDIREVLLWSLDKFGAAAGDRYRALLIQALRDLETDPLRPGSRMRPELSKSARTYHMALSRMNVERPRVKAPRHFILYRISSDGIEVARILHDSRDLARHLPADYQV